MSWLPLAATLLLAGPTPVVRAGVDSAPGSLAAAPTPISLFAAPVFPPAGPALQPASILSENGGRLVGVCLLIAGMGCAAWLLQRKRAQPRHIHVLDTATLGPKRSLALVLVNGQSLLLSCCDSGIALLAAQPASPEMIQAADRSRAGLKETSGNVAIAPALATTQGTRTGFDGHLVEAEALQQLRESFAQAGGAR